VYIIYRPGSQAVSELFFEELTSLLETVATCRCRIIISGDFNIHANDPRGHLQRLAEIIESFDLSQVVSGPTHRDGNTLDLVLTRRDCQPISCDVQPPGMISDLPVSPRHGRLNKCVRGRNLTQTGSLSRIARRLYVRGRHVATRKIC